MSKVKIKLADNIARIIFIEKDATIGAQLGTDLRMPDGSLATAAKLNAYLGDSSGSGVMDHRLLRGLNLGDDHPQYTRKDTLTTRGDLYVRGASTIERRALGTVGQLLRSNGTDPVWATLSPTITLSTDLSGNVTLADLASGTLTATVVNNAITNAKLRDSAAASVIGRSLGSSGDPADIVSSLDGQVLFRDLGVVAFDLLPAEFVTYDNVVSGLTATDVQAAIDEVAAGSGGGGGGYPEALGYSGI